jgi:hypothetical protein
VAQWYCEAWGRWNLIDFAKAFLRRRSFELQKATALPGVRDGGGSISEEAHVVIVKSKPRNRNMKRSVHPCTGE